MKTKLLILNCLISLLLTGCGNDIKAALGPRGEAGPAGIAGHDGSDGNDGQDGADGASGLEIVAHVACGTNIQVEPGGVNTVVLYDYTKFSNGSVFVTCSAADASLQSSGSRFWIPSLAATAGGQCSVVWDVSGQLNGGRFDIFYVGSGQPNVNYSDVGFIGGQPPVSTFRGGTDCNYDWQ